MAEWQDWIGREEQREDRIDAGLVARWCATFDRDRPADGTAPQGLHWCLGLPDAPTAMLGADGHPRRDDHPGSFLPPIPLPRRMLAGSSVAFHAPLPIEAPVERISRITAITAKQGASGALVFVEITHHTRHDATLLVSETQNVVYREAALRGQPAQTPASAPSDMSRWTTVRQIMPDPTLLFRYSALTFNSHRIHYDLPYAIDQEGYRGLVVHGPLMASLLLDLVRRKFGDNRVASFRFRALAPAIAGEPLVLAMREALDECVLGVFSGDARHVMDATATVVP